MIRYELSQLIYVTIFIHIYSSITVFICKSFLFTYLLIASFYLFIIVSIFIHPSTEQSICRISTTRMRYLNTLILSYEFTCYVIL